jgi:hypothetical protein
MKMDAVDDLLLSYGSYELRDVGGAGSRLDYVRRQQNMGKGQGDICGHWTGAIFRDGRMKKMAIGLRKGAGGKCCFILLFQRTEEERKKNWVQMFGGEDQAMPQ